MLIVIMLNVTNNLSMLSVVTLNVLVLSIVGPFKKPYECLYAVGRAQCYKTLFVRNLRIFIVS